MTAIPKTASRRLARFGRFIRFSASVLPLCACLSLCACGKRPADHVASPPPTETLLPDETARLSATLSTNTIRIGDPIDLTLAALHRPGALVEFPISELGCGKDVIVRSAETQETIPAGNGLERTVRRFQLTSLVVSNHIVAENASVLVHAPDGAIATQSMPFVSFEVLPSLAPGESDPRPLDLALAHWPPPPSRVLRNISLLLLALAILVVLAIFLARRFASTSSVIRSRSAPPTPPHVIALSALDSLAARNLPAQRLCEPFYVALSSIVRNYLEGRFALNAPDQTTEEFIRTSLRASVLSAAQRRLLAEFLEQADLVKFARETPSASEMETAFSSARDFVLQTAPAEAPAGRSTDPGVTP